MDPDADEALRRAIRDVRRVKLVHLALGLIGLALLGLAAWLGSR